LRIDMPAVRVEVLLGAPAGETSLAIRERVCASRERQRRRFSSLRGVHCNAQIPVPATQAFCPQDSAAQRLLLRAMNRFRLSARVYHRVLRIARTIADLAGKERLSIDDVAEALQYRALADHPDEEQAETSATQDQPQNRR
jgi:magnesium chelatase family protein